MVILYIKWGGTENKTVPHPKKWGDMSPRPPGICAHGDCSKIYHITLIMCTPYFVNLNNNTFQLKTLLFFVYLRSQQKRTESHLQLSNLKCCQFDIVILRVAIISNVQYVRLQRRHRPTDDASTRRRRGSQQTGAVRTTR